MKKMILSMFFLSSLACPMESDIEEVDRNSAQEASLVGLFGQLLETMPLSLLFAILVAQGVQE